MKIGRGFSSLPLFVTLTALIFLEYLHWLQFLLLLTTVLKLSELSTYTYLKKNKTLSILNITSSTGSTSPSVRTTRKIMSTHEVKVGMPQPNQIAAISISPPDKTEQLHTQKRANSCTPPCCCLPTEKPKNKLPNTEQQGTK